MLINYICCFHCTPGSDQANEKGSFCKLVHQPVGQEKNLCAPRLNKRLGLVQEFVAVQLSGSQPPTRPGMTQSLSEK